MPGIRMTLCAFCKANETELYVNGIPVCPSCSDAPKRKPPVMQQEMRNLLLQETLESTAHHNEAREEFEAVMGQIPSGLPCPDGTQRITNASRRLSIARKKMITAHNRLDRFLETGTVPEIVREDLKRSG
jgi:hypothetical protein